MKREKMQSGRSMVEMLGVLAVVGVLSIGGLAGYSQCMGKFEADKAANEMKQHLFGIKDLFYNSSNYEGISTTLLTNAGVMESTRNYFDQSITVGAANLTVDGNTVSGFRYTYFMPVGRQDICRKLLLSDIYKELGGRIVRIHMCNGVNGYDFTLTGSEDRSFPITIAGAEAACNFPNRSFLRLDFYVY